MNNIDKIFTSSKTVEEFSAGYINYLSKVISFIDVQQIGDLIRLILNTRDAGKKIYFMGNGGSAATSSHFANDLAIGSNSYDCPIKAISLSDNLAIITAIANDFGYDEIFLRQLKVLLEPGDIVVGISASGNSKNIINAFEYAISKGNKTVALTAFDGGQLLKMADHAIHIPTDRGEYGPAEDGHMILDHLIGAFLMRHIQSEIHAV
jgi:D-sedoheptulose 7-phosphate isomerase